MDTMQRKFVEEKLFTSQRSLFLNTAGNLSTIRAASIWCSLAPRGVREPSIPLWASTMALTSAYRALPVSVRRPRESRTGNAFIALRAKVEFCSYREPWRP